MKEPRFDEEDVLDWVRSRLQDRPELRGRKFTDDDVVLEDAMELAEDYVVVYDGDLQFMDEMWDTLERTGSLSIPQARGVLNVARAAALRLYGLQPRLPSF